MSISIATNAKFYDGKTSKAHRVSVIFSGSILHITDDETGENLTSWSLNTLTLIEAASPPIPAVIGSTQTPDARLNIEDGKGWTYLKSRIPKHSKRSILLPTHWSSLFGYAALAVLSLGFIFMIFPSVLGNMAYMMPASWEQTLGNRVMASMIDNDKTCNAPQGQKALNRLTQTIQSHMERDIKYDVRVIDNKSVLNAYAAPGGHIVIYRKIIDDANSPDEIAGVLAHEMSHVELRHPTKSLIRNIGLGFTLSLVFGDVNSVESMASLLSQLNYSRKDESDADQYAVTTLNAARINPEGLRDFLGRVSKYEPDFDFKGSEWLEYLSSHPNTQQRIDALESAGNKRYDAALSGQEWQALRSICRTTKPSVYKE
tara:strand:+ start:1024 stop:2139 length:1116 start_codon:yes stop_codon:yes gene_type:complete